MSHNYFFHHVCTSISRQVTSVSSAPHRAEPNRKYPCSSINDPCTYCCAPNLEVLFWRVLESRRHHPSSLRFAMLLFTMPRVDRQPIVVPYKCFSFHYKPSSPLLSVSWRCTFDFTSIVPVALQSRVSSYWILNQLSRAGFSCCCSLLKHSLIFERTPHCQYEYANITEYMTKTSTWKDTFPAPPTHPDEFTPHLWPLLWSIFFWRPANFLPYYTVRLVA